jgi:hypothetical protein
MTIRGRVRRLIEDHARRRAQRHYDDSVDAWIAKLADYQYRIALLSGPGLTRESTPIGVWTGETCLGAWGVTLVAARSTRVTNYAGVSYRTSQRTTVRAGQARSVSTPDEIRPIDQGTFVVTDRRFVFVGRTQNVTWDFGKLVSTNEGRGMLVFHVSNRQRAQGIQFGRATEQVLRYAVEAGLARYDGSASETTMKVSNQFLELARHPPQPGEGIEADPRVAAVTRGDGHTAQLPTFPTPEAPRVRLGLAVTPVEVVIAALAAASVTAPVLTEADTPTPDWESIEREAAAGAEHSETFSGQPFIVLAGGPIWLAEQLDLVGTHLIVCAPEAVLAAVGIHVADLDDDEPAVIGYAATPFDEIFETLRSDFGLAARVRRDGPTIERGSLTAANVVARLYEALGSQRGTVAIVDTNSTDDLDAIRAQLQAFDTLAFVGDSDTLHAAHIPIADTTAVEPDESPTDLIEVPALIVASREVASPQAVALSYLKEHGGTVTNCDFAAGTFPGITSELVRATRWMSSRISHQQEQWLIERSATADWASVPLDANLADADPTVSDELYDVASALYSHFRDSAPKGIGPAKVSKCLYLMRPALFPILDSQLRKRYETVARATAKQLAGTRAQLTGVKWAYWEAIRRDLGANANTLAELSQALQESDWVLAKQAGEQLSALRLLDICSWSPGPDAQTDD